jgi:hypothetical protein
LTFRRRRRVVTPPHYFRQRTKGRKSESQIAEAKKPPPSQRRNGRLGIADAPNWGRLPNALGEHLSYHHLPAPVHTCPRVLNRSKREKCSLYGRSLTRSMLALSYILSLTHALHSFPHKAALHCFPIARCTFACSCAEGCRGFGRPRATSHSRAMKYHQ